jgi:hypothetical protein
MEGNEKKEFRSYRSSAVAGAKAMPVAECSTHSVGLY